MTFNAYKLSKNTKPEQGTHLFFRTNKTLNPSKLPQLIIQVSMISHHHKIHQTNKWQSFAICYEEQGTKMIKLVNLPTRQENRTLFLCFYEC